VPDQQYDYIVVGAGSSGCAVAGRLSEDPACRVLLLEAGGTDRTRYCTKPGMVSIIHTIPQVKKRFDWGYYTKPQAAALDRRLPYPRGKVLGGSSSINGMVFVRGNRKNFDDWAAEGCDGWTYDEVLPYFKRFETFSDGDPAYRGQDGPVHITRRKEVSPVSTAVRNAIADACDVPLLDDYNAGEQEGSAFLQMNAKDGRRYSTSEAYIEPARARDNFAVETGVQVLRVLLEGTRAVGVEYSKNGEVHTVRADAEIVLSGGVVGSAQILMLSGIGPARHLAEMGIDVVADLPVGDNLHDHLFVPLVFLAPRAGHRGTATHFLGGMLKEFTFGGTWFGQTVFEVMAFLNAGLGSDVPDLQVHSLPWAYPAPNQDAPGRPKVDKRPAITVQPTMIYPKSRGTLRLKSGDPNDAPIIDPAYLTNSADVDLLMRGIEITREFMANAAVTSELKGELHPGADFSDSAAMRKELPNRVCTVYHPVGTCRMGTDERAVVDPQLRVRGIEGLRVADASIMPTITGGNTNAPCIMIGEKAADLLRGKTA
jgi:choline dehydrogenase-like flavoprotein